MIESIRFEILKDHIEKPDQDQPENDHDKRRTALMNQHFIDDDLEEQWCYKCKKLNEE